MPDFNRIYRGWKMGKIGIGCLVVVVLGLIVAVCFGALGDDEAEIEIEEGRVPVVETLPA